MIGGKPVPHVGWVFVARTPVRGPKSRQSVREARDGVRAGATDAKQRANSRVRAKPASTPDDAEPDEQPAAEQWPPVVPPVVVVVVVADRVAGVGALVVASRPRRRLASSLKTSSPIEPRRRRAARSTN